MQTRKLGFTDLHLTEIGFGAWALGGDGWAFGWGPQDDSESIAAIRKALDLGSKYKLDCKYLTFLERYGR